MARDNMDKGPFHNVYHLPLSRRQIVDEALSLIYAGMDIFESLKPDPIAIFITTSFHGILEACAQYSDEISFNK